MGPPVNITVGDLAEQMHVKPATLYELARRDVDPLPLRTLHGFRRSSSMLVSEWSEWFIRNSDEFKEARHA